MANQPPANADFLQAAMLRLGDNDPETRMVSLSAEQRLKVLRKIKAERGIKSAALREEVAAIFDREADIGEDANERQATARSIEAELATEPPTEEIAAIMKEGAEEQDVIAEGAQKKAQQMQVDVTDYGNRIQRNAEQAGESAAKAQTDAEADAIRRSLLTEPKREPPTAAQMASEYPIVA